MTNIPELAGRLSRDQRSALSAPKWCMLAQYNAGILELLNEGLLVRDGWGHAITPLGQQVRAYLQGDKQ